MTESKNAKPVLSIPELFLLRHPTMRFGMVVFIDQFEYRKWLIARALKARKAKKGRKSKWR